MSEHGSAVLDGTTHSEGCYTWGRGHYDCAMREIDRLLAEVAVVKQSLTTVEAERDALQDRIASAATGEVWQHACQGGQRTSHIIITRDAVDGLAPIGKSVALVVLG